MPMLEKARKLLAVLDELGGQCRWAQICDDSVLVAISADQFRLKFGGQTVTRCGNCDVHQEEDGVKYKASLYDLPLLQPRPPVEEKVLIPVMPAEAVADA